MALNNMNAFVREYIDTKVFYDSYFENVSPLYKILKGKMESYGGSSCDFNVEGAESTDTGTFARTVTTFSTTPHDFAKRATLPHGRYHTPVALYLDDMAQCQDSGKVMDILKMTLKNSQKSISKKIIQGVYGSYSTNAMYGLGNVCGTAASVYAGITPASDVTQWVSNGGVTGKQNMTSYGSAGMPISELRDAIINGTFGNDGPDIVTMPKTLYSDFEGVMEAKQEASETRDKNKLGFISLTYKGVPIYPDVFASTGNIWILNTEYLKLKYLKGWKFHVKPFANAEAADKYLSSIIFRGTLVCTDRRSQALLYNVDTIVAA